jgi:LmbE family N-acetylglucosaminyl deacetylase
MSEQGNGNKTPLRILVIAAHADDIEFGAAGSIAKWVHEGAQVTYCIVTDNGAGSNEPGVERPWLVQRRQEEQIAAAAVLGVTDVRFLGYPDGELEASLAVRKDLTRLIREVRPQRVLCQDPTTVFVGDWYINHPDHRAAGEASLYAVFPSAGTRPIFADLLDEGYEPFDVKELYIMLSMQPETFVDVTDTLDLKIKSLLCHKTQLGEDVADRVRERASAMGEKAGTQYAEAYRVMRFGPPEELPEEYGEAEDLEAVHPDQLETEA